MPRQATHKFAIQTKGLTHEQAALLHYLLASAAEAVLGGDNDRYTSASNVPVKVLRAAYPDSDWSTSSTKERVALVD